MCRLASSLFFYTLVFFFFSGLSGVLAQEKVHSKSNAATRLYQNAQIQVNLQDWEAAKTLLKEALEHDPAFAEANQMLGDLYRKQKNYSQSETYYLKALALKPAFLTSTYYGLAMSQFYLMNYEAAEQNLTNYLATGRGSDKDIATCKKYLLNARFARFEMQHPKPFIPVNLGSTVNSPADEYLPSVTIDDSTLIFTRRAGNEDFYVSTIGENSWSKARSMDESINTAEYNEGAGCISADGQTLYLTICSRPGVIGRCDIYVSRKVGYHWDVPVNLGPEVNTEGWESQPSISADGSTLYFMSTRPGGYGGSDIWRVHKLKGGHWSKPENLGPTINTAGNEEAPFIHADNQTLYFSSDGWPGMGGKDLYYSKKAAGGKWTTPVNLGYPINTSNDESTLVVSADGRKGYFASNNLKGFGKFDLYSFDLYADARPRQVSFIKGNVFDQKTLDRIDANVEVISLTDGTIVYSSLSNIVNGNFLAGLPIGAEYVFHVSKKGYIFYSENLNLKKGDASFVHNLDIPLRRIALGARDILKNVFFETDSYVLRHESKIELDKLALFMKINPGVAIEISGHTDNQGLEKHNLLLSENRAKAVYVWLISTAHFAETRFSYKGYGKSMPVASNRTEAGRALNRRTEFKITGVSGGLTAVVSNQ